MSGRSSNKRTVKARDARSTATVAVHSLCFLRNKLIPAMTSPQIFRGLPKLGKSGSVVEHQQTPRVVKRLLQRRRFCSTSSLASLPMSDCHGDVLFQCKDSSDQGLDYCCHLCERGGMRGLHHHNCKPSLYKRFAYGAITCFA